MNRIAIRPYLMKLKGLSVKQIIYKSLYKLEWLILTAINRTTDSLSGSYSKGHKSERHISFLIQRELDLNLSSDSIKILEGLCEKYLRHEFDLLGSGWVKLTVGMICNGFEDILFPSPLMQSQKINFKNYSNKKYSNFIRSLISEDYSPVDWQLDFKSGYRWDHNTYYLDIKYGNVAGADIKVPWEFARLQHLPQLALAFAGSWNEEAKKNYVEEFKNIVLDFISSNPPRYGVNWVCTMEVGIRVANLLVAMDIFKFQGVKFEPEFEDIFCNSICDHRNHILKNLEWSDNFRGNHYLANLVGGLIIERYCLNYKDRVRVLSFYVFEFYKEVKEQFNIDGSNFEGSTAYHQLSAEFLVIGASILRGINEASDLSDNLNYKIRNRRVIYRSNVTSRNHDLKILNKRIEKAINGAIYFSDAIELPCKRIIQIGDNDSGRLFKFNQKVTSRLTQVVRDTYINLSDSSNSELNYLYTDQLNYDGLREFYDGLYGINSGFGASYVSILSCRNYIFKNENINNQIRKKTNLPECSIQGSILHQFKARNNINDDLVLNSFPDFGLHIWRGKFIYMAIRCGSIGQKGWGGHAHNDQLHIELWIDGVPLVQDPGSYIYTASKEIRNLYRSAKSHFVPYFGNDIEPGSFSEDIFRLGNEAQAKVLDLSLNYFLGSHQGYGFKVYREVIIKDRLIEVRDWCNDQDKKIIKSEPVGFSDGYGWRKRVQ